MENEWIWLTISRHIKGQLFILDTSCKPNELQEFQKRFEVGKAVSCYVLSANKEKKLLRIVLREFSVSDGMVNGKILNVDDQHNNPAIENLIPHIHEGDTVGGRISKILPGVGGLLVQIAPHLYGKVHFTELQDSWVSDPLSSYHEGQFVKCKVLEISHSEKGTIHVDLSLRSSINGMHTGHVEKIDNLHPNMLVQVKICFGAFQVSAKHFAFSFG